MLLPQRIHALADRIDGIRRRVVRGSGSEFERHAVMRDLLATEQEVRTCAHQVETLLALIVAVGDETPTHPPCGGGRRA